MFGYVLPSREKLTEEERAGFQSMYCGLCHTLRENYGFAASLILNYDLTYLAVLLSDGEVGESRCRRCVAHPCKGRCAAKKTAAKKTAAAKKTTAKKSSAKKTTASKAKKTVEANK